MPISKLSVVEPPQPTRLNIPNRSDRAIYARIFTAANSTRKSFDSIFIFDPFGGSPLLWLRWLTWRLRAS
jgi:hypothetical protein